MDLHKMQSVVRVCWRSTENTLLPLYDAASPQRLNLGLDNDGRCQTASMSGTPPCSNLTPDFHGLGAHAQRGSTGKNSLMVLRQLLGLVLGRVRDLVPPEESEKRRDIKTGNLKIKQRLVISASFHRHGPGIRCAWNLAQDAVGVTGTGWPRSINECVAQIL